MIVSRRLPLHGAFAGCEGLVEMRYFRFQGGESKVAAVLFGVLEEANLPQSKRLRKKLTQVKDRSQDTDRRLLEFVLDPLISQEVLLSVWNYERGFYVHLKRMFKDSFGRMTTSDAEMLESLQRDLQVEIVNCRNLSGAHPGNMSIIWGETDTGAVLLYRQYAVSSIVITPCGHSFTKWIMFGFIRQIMGKPVTIEEFRSTGVKCHCGTDITEMAFNREMQETKSIMTDATEIYNTILSGSAGFMKYYEPFSYNLCCCCGKTMGMKICSNGHRMCMACVVGNMNTRLQFRCLLCQEKIPATMREELISQITTLAGVPRENITILCEGCGVESHFSEFVESWESPHGCLICRECRKRSEGQCFSCERPLPGNLIQPKTVSIYLPTERLICESCQREKGIAEFGAYLITEHKCVICNFCIDTCSIYGAGYCPKCRESVSTDQRNRGNVESSLIICCQSCHSIKEVSEYSLWSRLSHWFKCRICNSCFKPRLSESLANHCSICKKDYSQKDFELLYDRRQALLEEKKREVMTPERYCLICGQQQAPRAFSLFYQLYHTCMVCDKCFAVHPANISDSRGSHQQCPECRTIFDSQKSLKIYEYVKTIARPETGKTYFCLRCRRDKGKQEMTKCLSLTHFCKICDECLKNPIDPTRCPACGDKHSETDLAKLGRVSRQCSCGNRIAEDSPWRCPQKCLCSLCLMKYSLICGKPRCPACTLILPYYRLISPTCSHCHRQLNGSSQEMTKKVAGICCNMHVLCCFCIEITQSFNFCKVCRKSVELKSPEAIVSAQRGFQLACFCGEFSKGRHSKRIACGHEMHRECEDSTYFCRLCEQPVKAAPPSKCLRDYLQ